MEHDVTNSLTNERIARMLEWSGPLIADIGYPEWDRDVALAIRDILPEIVRRGYMIELCFGSVTGTNEMYLFEPDNCLATERWNIDPTNPSLIARAICEALVWVVGKS